MTSRSPLETLRRLLLGLALLSLVALACAKEGTPEGDGPVTSNDGPVTSSDDGSGDTDFDADMDGDFDADMDGDFDADMDGDLPSDPGTVIGVPGCAGFRLDVCSRCGTSDEIRDTVTGADGSCALSALTSVFDPLFGATIQTSFDYQPPSPGSDTQQVTTRCGGELATLSPFSTICDNTASVRFQVGTNPSGQERRLTAAVRVANVGIASGSIVGGGLVSCGGLDFQLDPNAAALEIVLPSNVDSCVLTVTAQGDFTGFGQGVRHVTAWIAPDPIFCQSNAECELEDLSLPCCGLGVCTDCSEGSPCGHNIACDRGLYCSALATCSAGRLGDACDLPNDCEPGLECTEGTCTDGNPPDVFEDFEGFVPDTTVGVPFQIGPPGAQASFGGNAFAGVGGESVSGSKAWMVVDAAAPGTITFLDADPVRVDFQAFGAGACGMTIRAFDPTGEQIGLPVTLTEPDGWTGVSFSGDIRVIVVDSCNTSEFVFIDDFSYSFVDPGDGDFGDGDLGDTDAGDGDLADGDQPGGGSACTGDAQCPVGEICEASTCVLGCRDDMGCPMGQICEAGLCVAGCRVDLDCPGGESCVAGQCLAPLVGVADSFAATAMLANTFDVLANDIGATGVELVAGTEPDPSEAVFLLDPDGTVDVVPLSFVSALSFRYRPLQGATVGPEVTVQIQVTTAPLSELQPRTIDVAGVPTEVVDVPVVELGPATESYPVYQFTLSNDPGDVCGGPHWHSPFSPDVFSLEAPTGGISDPNPSGCGYGNLDDAPTTATTVPLQEYLDFLGAHPAPF